MCLVKRAKNIAVTVIEQEEGDVNTWLLFGFFFLTVILFLAFTNIAISYGFTKEPENTPSNPDQYLEAVGSKVTVSVEVLPILGIKKVDQTDKAVSYTVFGNTTYGFTVFDQKDMDTVYGNPNKPGEGVVFSVPIEHSKVVLYSNY